MNMYQHFINEINTQVETKISEYKEPYRDYNTIFRLELMLINIRERAKDNYLSGKKYDDTKNYITYDEYNEICRIIVRILRNLLVSAITGNFDECLNNNIIDYYDYDENYHIYLS
jgi:hypothetical protein